MAECLEDRAIAGKTPDVLFVRPRQARMLHSGPAKIVLTALREMDTILTQLAKCESKMEFVESRKKLFSDYVNLSYIIANSFSMRDDRSVRRAAVDQAIKGVGQLFLRKGASRFGREAINEAVFCLDTLRRAYKLVDAIRRKGDPPASANDMDRELATRFNSTVLYAQLHLDCLRVVITQGEVRDQEVMDEILQGSRHSVMAYSYARQAVELRTKREPFLVDAKLDEEDRQLLDDSFSDYTERESNIDVKL